MRLKPYLPENELEHTMFEAQKDSNKIPELIEFIMVSDIFISSLTEVEEDGSGFSPLLFDKDGDVLVGCFSSISKPDIHAEIAKYILQMNGRELVQRIPPSYGIIINPGYLGQLIMTPLQIDNLKA